MCLILLSYRQHTNYPLIIAANRDEFYNRATRPAEFWNDHPDVLAGRDLQAGGTWFGVTRTGRIAMITNYREVEKFDPKAPTRGRLVSDFLIGNISPLEYLETIRSGAAAYNGFNLILGTRDDLYYFSNREGLIRKPGPGLYGLSNHLLDTPWPKVKRSKARFGTLVNQSSIDTKAVFDMLLDTHSAADEALPDTGVGIELERMLSPIFIQSPKYGTRCSTFVLVDKNLQMTFVERTYDPQHSSWTENRVDLEWGKTS